jgi:hypothetical protein
MILSFVGVANSCAQNGDRVLGAVSTDAIQALILVVSRTSFRCNRFVSNVRDSHYVDR